MDARSRRDRMREWIALGVREGLSSKVLAKRAGVDPRTLRRWSASLRQESEGHGPPDREDHGFVELAEHVISTSTRIEVVLQGERRIVIDGVAVVEAVARVLAAIERC